MEKNMIIIFTAKLAKCICFLKEKRFVGKNKRV